MISKRIALLIEEMQMTKTAFANTLNVDPSYISKIINKGTTPSDRLIEDICEKFVVNETWLRTGEGEMFKPQDVDATIANLTQRLWTNEPNNFRVRFVKMLAGLTENEWKMLENKARELLEDGSDHNHYDDVPKTPEELRKLYPPIDINKTS